MPSSSFKQKHEDLKRLRNIWGRMKQRTGNKYDFGHVDAYQNRGIRCCDEWKNSFMAFQKWALANGYSPDLTLDRIDNDKGYSPSNCRWADKHTQRVNQRPHQSKYTGDRTDWVALAEQNGMKPDTLRARVRRGATLEEALAKPLTKPDEQPDEHWPWERDYDSSFTEQHEQLPELPETVSGSEHNEGAQVESIYPEV